MTQIQNGNFDRTAFIEKKNDFFCDIIHKKNSFIHTAKANDCGRKKKPFGFWTFMAVIIFKF